MHKAPGTPAATRLLKGIVSSRQKAAWCLEEGGDVVTALVEPRARKAHSWDNKRKELAVSRDLGLEVLSSHR